MNPSEQAFVVGVGASAGGLEALEALFRSLPVDTGAAFIVLQHLSPDFKSRMDELLSRQTAMRIVHATDGLEVEPNHVYLAPAKKEMIISSGRLLLTDREPDGTFTLPIDRFFRSLAQDRGRRAVAIVLSGSGSDGSRGIRDIHEAGGLVLAQSLETAKFDGMPRSAVDTGVVDLVLAPHEMPSAIADFIDAGTREIAEPADPDAGPYASGIGKVFRLLRGQYGIDFAHYKPNTVARRVERRISMSGSIELDDYIDHLRAHPDELNALYRDLLIGVTRFFRDAEAFQAMGQVITDILAQTPPGAEIRIWIPGCATGEEVYSLAMLFDERLVGRDEPPYLRVFATDVHDASLQVAGHGIYPEEALAGVSEERRKRYFQPVGDGRWQVSKELRQRIVFARHNVISDAPFTRLDLISCRNLLIYFQPPAQKKVLSLFHFGLKTGGRLFLGPSETPGALADEFDSIDKHWKIYRKRRDIRLPADSRLPLSPAPRVLSSGDRVASGVRVVPDAHLLRLYDRLLAKHMPASLLVDSDLRLVHTFGGAEAFLRVPCGRTTTEVLDLVHPDLRTALSGAFGQAAKRRDPVRYTGIDLTRDGEPPQRIRLVVESLVDERTKANDFLVSIELIEDAPARPPGLSTEPAEVDMSTMSRDYIEQLEAELRFTKENLQATIEELETSNEELQATNEELVASNEELQSTNEELHSVNEELYTVNAEHQRQIAELTELTNDMDSLLHTIDVGVLFLDHELRVRKFTSRIAATFHLLPQDVGRRFDNFAHSIEYPGLFDEVQRVIESEQAIEREVENTRGEIFYMRILPYRIEGAVSGVVLTLVDIGNLRRTEADVERLSQIVESCADAVVGTDLDHVIHSWNRGAEQLYGYASDEIVGDKLERLVPPDLHDELRDAMRHVERGELVQNVETVRLHRDGRALDVQVSMSPIRNARNRIVGASSIGRDISRRKRAEEEVQQAIRQRDQFIALLSHELRNPLMGILTAADLLRSGADGDGARRASDVISRQSLQMSRLLDDLLDVSRMRQDKIEMRRGLLDLSEVVDAALDSVKPRAEEARVVLDVTSASAPVWVNGDNARLQQLIVNLLDNAIKYTPEGKRIALRAVRENGSAVVEVSDEGIGIPHDKIPTVFEPFRQLDEPLRGGQKSMGLGLALVRSIARAHGGDAAVTSDGRHKGTRFTIKIPAADQQMVGEHLRRGKPEMVRRILLVEDDEDNRDLLAASLRARGYEVKTANNGTDALDALAKDELDIAIMDIGLPDMSGIDVARQARRFAPALYLVALTGHGRQSDRDAIADAGFDLHLVKPVRVGVLEEVIRERVQK